MKPITSTCEFRRFAYGYRLGEVPLPRLVDTLKPGTEFTINESSKHALRRAPAMVDGGCAAVSMTCPHPDLGDRDSMIGGTCQRFAREPPAIDRQLLGRLRAFVRKWLRENLRPLSVDTDVSFESWLEGTDYPEWRKAELRVAHDKCPNLLTLLSNEKYWKVKSFMKDETYPEYKWPRGINARSDYAKVVLGPFFHAIEHVVYAHAAFIKHIPVDQRPDYIMNILQGEFGKILATDYTSFEALFRAEIMDAVEFQLYEYMTSSLPEANLFKQALHDVLAGENFCYFRDFMVQLAATRMSGEMCTSLGNGFSNLMFMLFACELKGSEAVGVVEGDDGLFRVVGAPPTPEDFAALGLIIKLEVHDEISQASFCGMIFDEIERTIITDPWKVLSNFGWVSSKYARCRRSKLGGLIRCKALSLAHQYPGVPVVAALARYGLRATRRYKSMTAWARQRLAVDNKWKFASMGDEAHIPDKAVGPKTRLLVERIFKMPVEYQLSIEKYLDSLGELTPLRHPAFDSCPWSWAHYHAMYVWPMPLGDDIHTVPFMFGTDESVRQGLSELVGQALRPPS